MIRQSGQPSRLVGFVEGFPLFIYFGLLIFILSVAKWERKKDG